LQVHDELVFDCYREEAHTVSALIKSEMESAYELAVPLVVDMGFGETCLEAH
uniref:DNA polymerase n=1 Tax=Robiginitalea biformata TaxID=252307 RepID=UPI003D3421F7